MICAVPLTGTVPISKVLAPRFTVGMEDRGDVVVTCPVGLVLLVLLALLLLGWLITTLLAMLFPVTPVTETITL